MLPKSSGEHLVPHEEIHDFNGSKKFPMLRYTCGFCQCGVNIFTFVHPTHTHIQTFSLWGIHMWRSIAVVWTCQALIREHVSGFSCILTFKYVCFSMSVTSLLCFHNAHLVWCPSGQKHLNITDYIASRSVRKKGRQQQWQQRQSWRQQRQ